MQKTFQILQDLQDSHGISISQSEVPHMLESIVSRRIEIVLMQKLAQLSIKELSDVMSELKQISEELKKIDESGGQEIAAH